MDHITIPIPEGMDATQREQLTSWLRKEAAAAMPKREAFEDDPAWQQETARRIKAGIEASEAGEVMTSTQARRRLDAKLGIERAL